MSIVDVGLCIFHLSNKEVEPPCRTLPLWDVEGYPHHTLHTFLSLGITLVMEDVPTERPFLRTLAQERKQIIY